MSTTTIVVLSLIVLAVIAIGAFLYWRWQRTSLLRQRFGPEYGRMLDETGSRSRAEQRLERRAERVSKYELHPLAQEARSRYAQAWNKIQAEFVDSPKAAVGHAEGLLDDVMNERGYPAADFDRRANDLTVDYPAIVPHYRMAHEVATGTRDAGTEDLRNAMLQLRSLFEELAELPRKSAA